ncbi:MAG: HAD-IA family hydrolase [Synechococcales cyanobacterium SupBloom_Metag_052]|jgi:phosphoglycolate phosphatase|nr:HAD-IA family hydrolase [Synechococcales cyanobacterium SupBloom_Metag_052]
MPRLLLRGADLGDVEAVLFDKDGTLSHSEPNLLSLAQARVLACLEQVAVAQRAPLQDLLERAYGLQAGAIHPAGVTAVAARDHNLIATATALAQVGLGWPEALTISEAVFAASDQGDRRRSGEPGSTSNLTAGLRPLLEELHSAGVACAVISNDDRAGIEHFLASHNLGGLFAGYWSAEHRPRKPDPAAVHGLCAELGLAVGRCALIGDANSDLQMARAAGIPTQLCIGYMDGWSSPPPLGEPHPLIHHWSELRVQAAG